MKDLIAQADFIIIGSGPAGASAAQRLVSAGKRVVMLDAGGYLDNNNAAPAETTEENISPKLRDPRYSAAFQNFGQQLNASLQQFSLWGMEAVGGLSNAWGGGIAEYTTKELGDATLASTMQESYRAVSQWLPIYGQHNDRLGMFYGRHHKLQPSTVNYKPINHLIQNAAIGGDIALGHARYTEVDDQPFNTASLIRTLEEQDNFTLIQNARVQAITPSADGHQLRVNDVALQIPQGKLLLGAGTIATTKLVLAALNATETKIKLQSSPATAFAVLFPEYLLNTDQGACPPLPAASLVCQLENRQIAFGNLFAPGAVAPLELIRKVPANLPAARQLIRFLSPGLVLGNCFFDGRSSAHSLQLEKNGTLTIHGAHSKNHAPNLKTLKQRLTKYFLKQRGIILPGSFATTPAGSDIHYAATLPMRAKPTALQTSLEGQIAGLPGITIIDGAVLPSLPAKAHTFTIMANADRLAAYLLATQ